MEWALNEHFDEDTTTVILPLLDLTTTHHGLNRIQTSHSLEELDALVDKNLPIDFICPSEPIMPNLQTLSFAETTIHTCIRSSTFEIREPSSRATITTSTGKNRKRAEETCTLETDITEPPLKRPRFKKFHNAPPTRVYHIDQLLTSSDNTFNPYSTNFL
ncbi:hypothetical protein LIER_23452 [Lithospermum erythrorhizon]|uniref:Uncharacterized protein n=1 Tax=Lithospermum erythrorhizon TaxID=34254 RepID=A0AAV3R067_LITER